MGKPIIWSGVNAKLINSGDLIDKNDLSLTNGDKITVTQASHGFTSSDVGRLLYLNGSTWTLAIANASSTAEVAGFIYSVIDSNTLRIATSGQIPTVGANFLEGGGSLVAGTVYFLSPTTAGKVTATEPTTIGYVSKPIGVASSTTAFQFFNFRGSVVGSSNARTQINLSNNTTGTVQSVSSYDAGSLAGWIYITATTSYRFYVQAQWAKNGAGTDYGLNYQTVGDTPPTSFSLTITSGGTIQYTLPSITGFSSAVFNYAINAPAVGTNYPLSIDGSAIVSGTVGATYLPVASNTASGIVSTSTQTFAGAKTFNSSIVIGGNTTSDANLGTISSVSNSAYYEGSFVANFNAGIANSTNNVTIKYVRTGNLVVLNIPSLKITAASTNYYLETPNGTLPSSLRPVADINTCATMVLDNNIIYLGGYWLLYNSGYLSFRNHRTNGAQTNWTLNTLNCGFPATWVCYTLT